MDISYSEIETWKRCRMRHFYAYLAYLEPIAPNWEHLLLGSAVHYGLERQYGYGESAVAAASRYLILLWEEYTRDGRITWGDRGAFVQCSTLAEAMLEHYTSWMNRTRPFHIIAVEQPFTVPIPGTDHTLSGIIDGIAHKEDGSLWIVEYKTKKTFPEFDHLILNEQSALYQWAAQTLLTQGRLVPTNGPYAGITLDSQMRFEGVQFIMLRKRLPEMPRLLQSGKLSQNRDMTTTPERYRAAIRAIGAQEGEYAQFLTYLDRQPDPFIRVDEYPRTESELARMARALELVAREMGAAERDPAYAEAYPSPSYACKQCPFLEVCTMFHTGGDDESMLEQRFRRRQSRSEQRSMLATLEEAG